MSLVWQPSVAKALLSSLCFSSRLFSRYIPYSTVILNMPYSLLCCINARLSFWGYSWYADSKIVILNSFYLNIGWMNWEEKIDTSLIVYSSMEFTPIIHTKNHATSFFCPSSLFWCAKHSTVIFTENMPCLKVAHLIIMCIINACFEFHQWGAWHLIYLIYYT